MHPIQMELDRLVAAGLPGAFVYIEDGDGTSQFYTAGYADLATRQRMTPISDTASAAQRRHSPPW